MRSVTPLKLAIVASGRPQREIAAALGMHESHLSRIVNGLHADEATRAAIAQEVGREPAELFGPGEEMKAAA